MPAMLEPGALRQAMSRFASGVAIATATLDGQRIGMTISSFNSVSLDPPLVLFSVARSSLAIDAWLAVDSFAINLLARSQAETAACFARASGDKWNGITTTCGRTGAPLLDGALAQFDCRVSARHDGGDHVILVGEVVALEVGDAAEPLLFYASRFCSIAHSDARPV